jgi:hypothetical protein
VAKSDLLGTIVTRRRTGIVEGCREMSGDIAPVRPTNVIDCPQRMERRESSGDEATEGVQFWRFSSEQFTSTSFWSTCMGHLGNAGQCNQNATVICMIRRLRLLAIGNMSPGRQTKC